VYTYTTSKAREEPFALGQVTGVAGLAATVLIFVPVVAGTRPEPPFTATATEFLHSDSPPGLPRCQPPVASHLRTQPEGQSSGHPDPPAHAATDWWAILDLNQ
jgi:hypothetical protein